MTTFLWSEEQVNKNFLEWVLYLQEKNVDPPMHVLEPLKKPNSVEENQHWGILDSEVIKKIYKSQDGRKKLKPRTEHIMKKSY